MKASQTIRVRACLAAVHDDRILLVPHFEDGTDPVRWHLPGGEVVFGESLQAAALRELSEETGLQARVDEFLDLTEVVRLEQPWHGITVSFLGSVIGGELTTEIHPRYGAITPRWFSAKEVSALPTHPKRAVEKALLRRGARMGKDRNNLAELRNPKEVVAEGYDVIGQWYADQAVSEQAEDRERYTRWLIDRLPAGAEVLDLGCGAGVLTTTQLAEHFSVTGVDISAGQVARARRNVPSARLVRGDMTHLGFAEASFDAVVDFYTIIHVPRNQHALLFRDIAGWLRPGGLFMAALGAGSLLAGTEQDWHGAPMFWSSFDSDTNKRLIADAGLELIGEEEVTGEEDGEQVTFLWVVARKPAAGNQ